MKQETPLELLTDSESSGLSSPPSSYGLREASASDYSEDVSKPFVEFSGSADTSPRSCYEYVDVTANCLVEDPWDLENVDCHLPYNFNWDNFQNEMFSSEDASVDVDESVPVLKKGSTSSKHLPKKETKKSALRGVKKKTNQLKIKREQNKVAASRYRTKKKEEESCMMLEYEELLSRNEKLKRVALDKEQEVKVLRKLLKDVLGK